MNHAPALNALIEAKHLLIRDPANWTVIAEPKIDRLQAWILTSVLWYERRDSCSAIKGADDNARHLTDLVHTLGTMRVTATLAFPTALLVSDPGKCVIVD